MHNKLCESDSTCLSFASFPPSFLQREVSSGRDRLPGKLFNRGLRFLEFLSLRFLSMCIMVLAAVVVCCFRPLLAVIFLMFL